MNTISQAQMNQNIDAIINSNSEADFDEMLEVIGGMIFVEITFTDSLSQRFGLQEIRDLIIDTNYKAATQIARKIGCDMLAGSLEEIQEMLKKAITQNNAAQ